MFVTNCISTTKIQKISEITNFFRHYFLSRTEVNTMFFTFRWSVFSVPVFAVSEAEGTKKVQYPAPF